MTGPLRYATVDDLARALRSRKISAVELANEVLAALASVGPRFNAIASLTPERALAEAARADRRLARGAASPLVGVPYGAKDLLAARGAPTTWGAPEYRERRLPDDATAIARLDRAGAVLAAKLAMVELAGGGGTSVPGASLQGQGRNPWNPAHYSGGSSSGPGIAVAAGLVPYALGSETTGSILGPAAYSGVTGLRPTYGLVPRTGAMTLSPTLDKIGVLARTAHDCALVLEAIAGPDGVDRTARGRFRRLDATAARAAVRRVRIGVAGDDVEACDPPVRRAIAAGLAALERATQPFVRAALPTTLPYAEAIDTILGAESAAAFARELAAPSFDLVDEKQKAGLRKGLEVRAVAYLGAQEDRTRVCDAFAAIFAEVDLLVSAARSETAPRLDAPKAPRTAERTPDRLRAAGNLAGLPAVFLPTGLADDGLPTGLQLLGPAGSEALLVAVAERFQRDTTHHLARPPLA